MVDPEYEQLRNSLMPRACTFADSQVDLVLKGARKVPDRKCNRWMFCFINEMDRLATDAGLQVKRFHKPLRDLRLGTDFS